MAERRTVGWALGLVGEVESLSAVEWKRFQGYERYVQYMDLYLTAKCLTDFYWHTRWGVYFNAWKHYDPGFHGPMMRWFQNWTRERHGVVEPVRAKAEITARNLCKSQLVISYIAWRFARDPSMRALVRSYNQPLANQIGSTVQKLLLSKKYTRRYPWVTPAARPGSSQWDRWTPGEFMLEREEEVRVPSFQAMGIEGTPTGSHLHLLVYDDFEVEENAKSEALRPALFTTYRNDDNLMEAGSQKIIAGTPWDPLAFIEGILSKKNGMEDHDIDIFKAPCTCEVFDRDFSGQEPVLMGNRTTLRCVGAGFPTAMETLATCQARVTFFSQAAGDTVEEVREVVWNDGEHFRVNRPFPAVLGQPLSFVIGREKPVAPVRQTLDSVDWTPELKAELPAVVAQHGQAPGVSELNGRFSLPAMLLSQGSLVFNAQQRLLSTNPTDLILHATDLQVIAWEDIPKGDRRCRRAADFASAKETAAATSITDGFELPEGFFITHISYVPRMSTTWKLLELVLGVKRVAARGDRLEFTTFEKTGHIEEVVKELLPDVLRDPYEYFMRLGEKRPKEGLPTYGEYAERWFQPGERVSLPIKWLSRRQSKNDHLASQQPVWQAKKLFILEDCPHRETLVDMADRFTLAEDKPFDLLENLADLLHEGNLLKVKAKPAVEEKKVAGDDFGEVMKMARERALQAAGLAVAPGWPG